MTKSEQALTNGLPGLEDDLAPEPIRATDVENHHTGAASKKRFFVGRE